MSKAGALRALWKPTIALDKHIISCITSHINHEATTAKYNGQDYICKLWASIQLTLIFRDLQVAHP
jgi:hypothetical protein